VAAADVVADALGRGQDVVPFDAACLADMDAARTEAR